jgi:CDP-4-dehydro-6-deoxyglucose reductase
MYQIKLRNNKTFPCSADSSIFEAALKNGIILEHSCLSARCRSCIVKVLEGKTSNLHEELVLSESEKKEGYILSCNARPLSDIKLDIEDLGDMNLSEVKTFPCKIDTLEKVNSDVLKVKLRLPPSANFNFISGQYVNIIKGDIKRSYSIANNSNKDSKIELFIKKYENGVMSNYWFEQAKENDLLRLVGPLGTFFYRDSKATDIVLLATGTGIAPVKAILEQINENKNKFNKKRIWVFWGGRFISDLFWKPKLALDNFTFIPVLSRPDENWKGSIGYVQDILVHKINDLENAQVYACGSNEMITSARLLLASYGLKENNFYSDAFVSSN